MPNRRTAEPDILVFKEKHATRYFPASTPELRARAFYTVLKERYEQGWYYTPEVSDLKLRADDAALLLLTDEQLAALPEVSRKNLDARIKTLRDHQVSAEREYERELTWFTDLDHLMSLPEDEAIKVLHPGTARGITRLETLAQEHDGYEYEEYEYEYFG